MRKLYIVLLFLTATIVNADWSPPVNPNPQDILNEAREDKQLRHYEDALAKHIWFHENALKYDRGLYGVRLSFALSDWLDLSKEYPPALSKLKEYANKAKNNITNSESCCREEFHDFVSINESLNNTQEIVSLFKWLDLNKPNIAKRNYDIAKKALIQAKEYLLCVKYINPRLDYERLSRQYSENIEMSKNPQFGTRYKEYAVNSFINEVNTMIALLSINSRHMEASVIAESAKKVIDNKLFLIEIERALTGIVPDQ